MYKIERLPEMGASFFIALKSREAVKGAGTTRENAGFPQGGKYKFSMLASLLKKSKKYYKKY